MMPGLRRALPLAALLGAAMPAFAQPLDATGIEVEQYAVELVIFRHENPPPAEPLSEPPDPVHDDRTVPSFGDTAAEAEPSAEALRREPLPEDALQLTDIAARLRNAYEPLVHTGWIQDSYPIGEAPAYHIDTAGHPELTGAVRFSRGRYLHLELDLRYRPQAQGAAHPRWEGFKITEERRLRDGEVHYFDNPYFGVIARVAPWPLEELEDAPPPVSLNERR